MFEMSYTELAELVSVIHQGKDDPPSNARMIRPEARIISVVHQGKDDTAEKATMIHQAKQR